MAKRERGRELDTNRIVLRVKCNAVDTLRHEEVYLGAGYVEEMVEEK